MNMTMHTTTTTHMVKNVAIETRLYENIILTQYIIDFGNAVVNYPKKK